MFWFCSEATCPTSVLKDKRSLSIIHIRHESLLHRSLLYALQPWTHAAMVLTLEKSQMVLRENGQRTVRCAAKEIYVFNVFAHGLHFLMLQRRLHSVETSPYVLYDGMYLYIFASCHHKSSLCQRSVWSKSVGLEVLATRLSMLQFHSQIPERLVGTLPTTGSRRRHHPMAVPLMMEALLALVKEWRKASTLPLRKKSRWSSSSTAYPTTFGGQRIPLHSVFVLPSLLLRRKLSQ